jgi:CBS domain-containing protein
VPEPFPAGRTVAGAMITSPQVVDATTTVRRAQEFFADDHVHALLVVTGRTLLAVVERTDLASSPPDAPARAVGRLDGRVVRPDAALCATWHRMAALNRRRLAVVDRDRNLLGLLCLKRSGRGFCSDAGVQERAAARR